MSLQAKLTLIGVLFVSQALYAQREYNTWYAKDGSLYGLTQTADSRPVLITLSVTGTDEAGLVVSFQDDIPCENSSFQMPFKIDAKEVRFKLSCIPVNNSVIKTYVVSDPTTVNYVLAKLRSGLTVVLMEDIKIWAGNINKPVYGTGLWTE
ncbi:hypothetical protein [uncultured Enterobacter sp.]|uniref:hypothetical protein n=1 Tax=uncultured Enterobacter sp. TaxID=238202 RepID=UPI0025FC42E8|nr:hypothetical protein [uncultured Enterobacter sp.]